MSFASKVRPLHWVFKIGDRKANILFFRDLLGMKTLRHEEFNEGCEATCNGPYSGRWSKTMIGYGDEDHHFVIELTYNYTVKDYKLGNDFRGITIQSSEVIKRAKEMKYTMKDADNKMKLLISPDGYKFYIIDQAQPKDKDPVISVKVGVSDMAKALDFWHTDLQMHLRTKGDKESILDFDENKVKVKLEATDSKIDRGTAFGRIACSIPLDEQPGLSDRLVAKKRNIIHPLIKLDTPGKKTVRVLIITDPDGQEICFVEDEGFRELSIPDTNGDEILEKSMKEDDSDTFKGI
ncbi:glyoxalase domain-containing protein 4 [Lepeophtheirus salmonis]|uniref:Glyoxalase domain-containing protein 4 n=1 Tax=Lepeophtheirus salmonis TaxID=72036 RepID=C1BTV4_LEPSM|nr:glyoxalase domain-containing protein 4-like [Lepeophtheirus salmonis]ACO12457.1 Glyoxalase domain-containing protein 4 [Lepeophtheirus salmonis]ADD24173.1 Glyoxalase domain-containing protein 4 [Lepeophtheirus salmonis]